MASAKAPDYSYCLICSKPIADGASVTFQHGDIFHAACPTPGPAPVPGARAGPGRRLNRREESAADPAR